MLLPHLQALNAHKKVILASASPRRSELLSKQLGMRFEVMVSSFEETLPKENYRGEDGAARYAVDTAKGKALDVYRMTSKAEVTPDLVIGADTVVEHAGQILEKPDDARHAFEMLSRLSGSQHHVHTGVVLVLPKAKDPQTGEPPYVRSFAATTTVQFDQLNDNIINEYIKSGEPFGKAGSYGIQGIAGSFVKGIDGCFFNVVGFPVHRFAVEMTQLIKQGHLPLS